jgi:hypothetical protein
VAGSKLTRRVRIPATVAFGTVSTLPAAMLKLSPPVEVTQVPTWIVTPPVALITRLLNACVWMHFIGSGEG